MQDQLCRIEKELQVIKNLLIDVLAGQSKVATQEEKIISMKEAVDFLGLEKHIIYSKCATGELPCFKVGKLYKFKRSDLTEWKGKRVDKQSDADDYVSKYLQTHLLKA
jgi:excisionase family DNA binding protein